MPWRSEQALELLGDFAVDARHDAVEEFDHRAPASPSRRHTEPSSSPITPAPTTSSRLGTAVERQRAGGGDDALLVDGDAGKRRHVRAGGDDDVLGLELARAVLGFDR